MTTLSTVATPVVPRGFMAKAGTFAAGTALAGAAIFGGATVAPTITSSLAASVQHDFVLTADGDYPTFTASLQSLLDAVGYGNMGDVLGLFGPDITTTSTIAALLSELNSSDTSLDEITGGLLSADISNLLDQVQIGDSTLGATPIDDLVNQFVGAGATLGNVFDAMGMHDFAGLLNLPFANLSPDTTVVSLVNELLGIDGDTTLGQLALGDGTLGEATIGGLLGLDATDLSSPWDEFIDGITLGGSLTDPDGTGTLGDETLGDLLTSLLGADADPVTDDTTLTDFLGDLGIFGMLGLG